MTVRLLQGPDTGFRDFDSARMFHDYEQGLFTRVVSIAEREGRPVKLLVVPSSQVDDAITQTAVRLQSSEIVVGESGKYSATQMAHMMGEAWERTDKAANSRSRLVAFRRDGTLSTFQLGPHAPPLTAEDLELIHRLWLDAVAEFGLDVHHRDVVRAALEELEGDMSTGKRSEALELIRRQVAKNRPDSDVQVDPPDEPSGDTEATFIPRSLDRKP